MNTKVLFALIIVLMVAIFGYSQYSSSQHEKQLAAMKAESERVQAETARLEAEQKKIDEQKEIIRTAGEEIAVLSPSGKSFLMERIPNAETQDFSPKNPELERKGREQLKELMKRWGDNSTLASRTARVSLPSVVRSLQDNKRELESMKLTPCLTLAQAHLYSAMDNEINAYLEFMSENESSSGEYLKSGTEDLDKFTAKIARCQ